MSDIETKHSAVEDITGAENTENTDETDGTAEAKTAGPKTGDTIKVLDNRILCPKCSFLNTPSRSHSIFGRTHGICTLEDGNTYFDEVGKFHNHQGGSDRGSERLRCTNNHEFAYRARGYPCCGVSETITVLDDYVPRPLVTTHSALLRNRSNSEHDFTITFPPPPDIEKAGYVRVMEPDGTIAYVPNEYFGGIQHGGVLTTLNKYLSIDEDPGVIVTLDGVVQPTHQQ